MRVELHVFSGRPNPLMELDEPRVNALRGLQQNLSATNHPPSVAPGLGYSGFSFDDRGDHVVVYDGYVQRGRRVLDDPTMSVELFLLDQLPQEMAAIRERVRAQLHRSRR
jgi:hypothetical protein